MMEIMDYRRHIEKELWLLNHRSSIIGIREGRVS